MTTIPINIDSLSQDQWDTLPTVSQGTKNILDRCQVHPLIKHESLWTISELKNKVQALPQSIERLQHAETHAARDKIIGFLKLALIVTLVALIITQPITLAIPLIILPILYGLHFTFEIFFHMDLMLEPSPLKSRLSYLAATLIPGISDFAHIKLRNLHVRALQEEIAADKEKLKTDLPQSIDYFKNHYPTARKQLIEALKEAEERTKKLQAIGYRDGRSDESFMIKYIETTISEMDKCRAFYEKLETKNHS